MSKLLQSSLIIRTYAFLASLLLLSACDGGIFGTGDETTIDTIQSTSDVESGGDSVEAEQNPPNSPPGVAPDTSASPSGTATLSQQSFENLQIGSTQIEPLMTLVNLSSSAVNVSLPPQGETTNLRSAIDTNAQSQNVLFESAIAPGSISNTVELQSGTSELTIFNTQSDVDSLLISPLNLGASSVTTLIVRDAIDQNSAPTIEVVALRTQRSITDPDVARVRLIQAYALDESDQPSTITLIPAGSNPGSNEVAFNVSAQTADTSSYVSVNAGSYSLTDALSRFEPESVDVQAGEIYTLIIGVSPLPTLIIQRDSVRAGE